MYTTNTTTTNDDCFLSLRYGRIFSFEVTTGTSTTGYITTTTTTTGDE
tara:strand:- start:73 stop:216 length:144 start_codon:yes stop_codon:yes gene_type:complete